MSPPSREEIEAGEQAEGLFRDFCDKFRITYVYLDQSSFNKSSRLVRENAARPDFLVMEPHKMPFFVDVKAHKFSKPGGDAFFFLGDKKYQAVFLSVARDFLPLRRFQTFVGIPVWFALFERSGSSVRPEEMHVAPVNALNDFLRGQPAWEFMQVPLECCTTINLKRGGALVYDVDEDKIGKFVKLLDKYIEDRGWKG